MSYKIGGVSSARIDNDAITSAKIADDAITAALIADDAVAAAAIADDAIAAAAIAADAVGASELADNAVDTAAIADNAVTAGKLADNLTYGSNLTVTGNLTVNGTTTTINSTTVAVDDHNIVLDKGNSTSAPVDGAGLTIEGGSGDDITFQYLASGDRMELKKGSSYLDIKVGTITGTIAGSSATADALSTARTIAIAGDATGSASFDGSANISISTTLGTVPVAKGGTGATTAAGARSALGVDAAGTDNSTNVTLASVSSNYLSLSGQEITAGTIPVSLGGTGATSASAARSALGVDAAGTDNSTAVTLASVSSNYLSLSGQEITAGTVPVALGGTGATSAGNARTALGVAIGSDVQAFSSKLASVANMSNASSGTKNALTISDSGSISSTRYGDFRSGDTPQYQISSNFGQSGDSTLSGIFPYVLLDSSSASSWTLTLPAVTSSDDGKLMTIKADAGISSSKTCTLDGNSSQTIDGQGTFVLNEARSAITLLARYSSGTGQWLIV
ncbi:MAG: hypothetical protein VXZ06_03125 [Actinomycetota bacterium]|nr:hypothetical protein [Actinomycetota bacterium]